jgi:cell division protein FtsI/penicillin-binding protein 2
LLAIVFFRLWLLQVLAGSQYLRAATFNGVREIPTAPPLVAQQVALRPYGDVEVRTRVSRAVQYFLAERRSSFRGVSVVEASVTGYLRGDLAAQTLGIVGPVSRPMRLSASRASRRITTTSFAAARHPASAGAPHASGRSGCR